MPPKSQRVLALVNTYIPGYKAGGPIRSVRNLVAALSEELEFNILTRDRDLGERAPYPGVVPNRWVRVEDAYVMYLSPGFRGILRMSALLRSVDCETILYLNSFFSRQFSMLAVLMSWLKLCRSRRLVLAPRGELFSTALDFKSKMRKRLYISVSRWLGLYSGITWHASSEFEAAAILRAFPSARSVEVGGVIPGDGKPAARRSVVITAPDIAGRVGSLKGRRPKEPGQLRVVFVARLTRNKNLLGALRVLEGVSGDISFDIYGPIEDADYWEECESAVARLPANIRVRHCGQVEHKRIEQVFSDHDLLLFPTLSENYGHVIAEALLSGCPVLISDRTPFRNLETLGGGWDIPLAETDRFRSVLQQCVYADSDWFTALTNRARDFAGRIASDPALIDANRKVFQVRSAYPPRSMFTQEL